MATEAENGKDDGGKSGGGNSAFIISLLILALIGAGAGAGFSVMFMSAPAPSGPASPGAAEASGKQSTQPEKTVKAAAVTGVSGKTGKQEDETNKEMVKDLDPILVTLAGGQRSWARLELGVVLTGDPKEDFTPLLKAMAEDMMSFMRTVPLSHIETASGVEYLREDLTEIARLRSKGRTRSVVMRSLVVE